MRILIDTNILISGLFFGGIPRKILSELDENFSICVNEKIVAEYNAQIDKKISNPKYHLNEVLREKFFNSVQSFEMISDIKICRDPDDDKFINCAIDAKAIYIVSGDKDLLTIREYNDIQILTAREFFDLYLQNERTTPETESEVEDDGTE